VCRLSRTGADSQVPPTVAESSEREHPLEAYLSEVISQDGVECELMRFCDFRDLHAGLVLLRLNVALGILRRNDWLATFGKTSDNSTSSFVQSGATPLVRCAWPC
jgi:hypothetical protein